MDLYPTTRINIANPFSGGSKFVLVCAAYSRDDYSDNSDAFIYELLGERRLGIFRLD